MSTNPPARQARLRRAAEFLRPARGAIAVILVVALAIAGANAVVVLKQGRIVEEGSHATLVAAGGYYASLVEKQTRGLLPMAA